MEEERPVREAREALERQSKQREAESEPIDEKTTEQEQTVSGTWTKKQTRLVVGGIVLVVLLIIVGLLLPPISLGERIGLFEGEATVPAQVEDARSGEAVVGDDFALALTSSAGDVEVNTLAQGAFMNNQAGEEWSTAMASIPTGRQLAGNVYSVSYGDEIPQGSAQIAIPAGIESRTLDLFGWDGQSWAFFASQVSSDGGQLTSTPGPLPQAFALMRTAAPVRLEITADVLLAENLPSDLLPLVSEISAGTLTLAQDGSVAGEVASIPTGGYRQLVRVTNVGLNDTGVVVDTASLAALLGNPATQQRNIQGMVNGARSAGFLGVNLDYRGVSVSQRQAFSAFVNDLAVALHGQPNCP